MNATDLRTRVAGTVVARDEPGYDDARRALIWNALVPERRPEMIVRVASTADVVATVRFARETGRRIAVRGGGHSWCAAPLRDDGIALDLGALDRVLTVDAAARRATVEPAVTNGVLATRLAHDGLAFPYGHCASVPVSGYVLSGGLGWNAGVWGPACASVDALEVVTADGETRHASADENADLLWAARGAGAGFFGVVTRFELRLHPLPRAITTSTWVYPIESLGPLAAWLEHLTPRLAPEVELVMFLGAAPPPAAGAAASGGRACIVSATAFVDDAAAAHVALAPLASAPCAGDVLSAQLEVATPYDALFDAIGQSYPAAHRWLADTFWTDAPLAQVLGAVRERFVANASPRSLVLCGLTGTAAVDPVRAGAFSMRGRTLIAPYTAWDDPHADAEHRAAHRAVVGALEPFADGHYLGEADLTAAPDRATRSFSPATWERLAELRRRWDPDGVFHGFLTP